MDDLLREFLTESSENLLSIEQELVELEQSPDDADIIASIFRTIHTIKGTCGFLGLSRLERVAHSAESVLGMLREGDLVVDASSRGSEPVTEWTTATTRSRLSSKQRPRGGWTKRPPTEPPPIE